MRFVRERRAGLTVGVAVAVVVLLLYRFGSLDGPEYRLLDFRFRLRGERLAPADVVIAAIDDDSLAALGELPWPRDTLAAVIARLASAKPSAIALDLVELTRPAGGGDADVALVAAIRDAGNVVLPMHFETWRRGQPEPAQPAALSRFAGEYVGRGGPSVEWRAARVPDEPLCEAAAGLGSLNVNPETDGAVRAVPMALSWGGRAFPSFAAATTQVVRGQPGLRVATGHSAELSGTTVPLTAHDETLLNLYGPYKAFRYVPVAELMRQDAELAQLRDKVALVGKTAAGSGSKHRTALHPYVPGVELQATAVANLMQADFLAPAPAAYTVLSVILAAALAGLLCAGCSPGRAVVVLVGLWIVGFASLAGLFFAGIVARMAEPLTAAVLSGVIVTSLAAAAADRSRARAQSVADTLQAVGNMVRSTLNRPELLRAILEYVRQTLDAGAASLLTVDEDTGDLVFEVALGEKGEEVSAFKIAPGEGLVGFVVERGESVVVNEPEGDPRFRRDIAEAIEYPVRNALCVPLRLKGRIIGVIEVLNKQTAGGFTDADLLLLETIASPAAVFIENVQLYAKLEDRVQVANRELVAANRELGAQKARIEAIVQGMADGLVALDGAGRVTHVNAAAARMLGVDPDDLYGRPATECFADPDLQRLFRDLIPAGDAPPERELTVAAPQALVLRGQAASARDERGAEGWVVVLTDITQLKELDRMKSELVSFASHELRNPLTAVKGFTALLAQEDGVPPAARHYVSTMETQVDRMRRLVEDFLNIARLEAGHPLEMNWTEVSDVGELVGSVVNTERPNAPRHEFRLNLDPGLPVFEADRDKLYQVLANIVNNAVKYSPRGGTVTVTVRPNEEGVLFSVTDEGIGIAPEDMRQLFRRYRRVRRGGTERVTGTGLGLYLAKHLVEAHGGRIWADSTAGEGSTFHFAIPLHPPRPEEDA